jgi:hypothetical protein
LASHPDKEITEVLYGNENIINKKNIGNLFMDRKKPRRLY